MKSFLQLKLDMEVDIDGMLVNENKKIIFHFKEIPSFQFISFLYSWTFYNIIP